MNIGIATIAALLLLLPGVGFVIGVNFADKNVREIVFRNTPAELGYVIVVALVVHLLIAFLGAVVTALLSWLAPLSLPPTSFIVRHIVEFNAASIYAGYSNGGISAPEHARNFLIFSLSYFFFAAVIGFLPGLLLGHWVRQRKFWWTSFFVKHRWMLDLIPGRAVGSVSARALLKDRFPVGQDRNAKGQPVVVEGVVRDIFFAADGKLLYLVFDSIRPSNIPEHGSCFDGLSLQSAGDATEDRPIADQLVVEGDRVQMVRYYRRGLPLEKIAATKLPGEDQLTPENETVAS
jgi:hypothetical protein